MDISLIQNAISANRVRVTDHADEEMAADALKLGDIFEAVNNGEIIEDYPSDYPLPSCLIDGNIKEDEHVHSVWGYNETMGLAVLITAYRPDPNRWEQWRRRK